MSSTSEIFKVAHVFDGLNCAAVTREQLTKTLQAGVSVMNLTATRPSAGLVDALLQIEQVHMTVATMPDIARIVTTMAEIETAREDNVLGVIIGAQNSLMVELDVRLLRTLKTLGMRILQPTYNERNAFGYGASFAPNKDGGITDEGRAWLAEMEALGLVVDLSHCGHQTSADYIAAAKAPLVFSHANAYSICPSPRNKTDALIRSISEKGGLIGAVTWAPLVRWDARPTIGDYVDHVVHMINVAGIEHVTFASDLPEGFPDDPIKWSKMWGHTGLYPDITGGLGSWYKYGEHSMVDMHTLTGLPLIWDKLKDRGFHESDVEKMAYANWMRILAEVWTD